MSDSAVTFGTLIQTMDNLEEMGRLLISTDKETLRAIAMELKNKQSRGEKEDDLLGYINIQLSRDKGLFF